jgi:hypothetical protein
MTWCAVAPWHAPFEATKPSHVSRETPLVCAATSTAWSWSADQAWEREDPCAGPHR